MMNLPGYQQIPQIQGPDLNLIGNVCFLATEADGFFELENGNGVIQLETCNQIAPVTWLIELENLSGFILLEDSLGYIELERGP